MPHIGEVNIGGNWINLVTHFTPNLVVGTKYRLVYLTISGGEYLRLAGNPGNVLKKHGVPLSGIREIVVEAGIGIWIRSMSEKTTTDGLCLVETA